MSSCASRKACGASRPAARSLRGSGQNVPAHSHGCERRPRERGAVSTVRPACAIEVAGEPRCTAPPRPRAGHPPYGWSSQRGIHWRPVHAHIGAMDTTLHSQGGSTNHARPRFIVWLMQSWGRRPAKRPDATTAGWHDTIPVVWSHNHATSRCWPADRGSRSGVDARRTQRGE